MAHAPLRCQTQGLFAIKDIADDVRRKEGQIDQLVKSAVARTLSFCDLRQCFAYFDLLKPPMRFGDFLDQGLVQATGSLTKDQLSLNAALSELGRRAPCSLIATATWVDLCVSTPIIIFAALKPVSMIDI